VATAAECARRCKADIDCVSFDFSAGRRRCVLGADIEGQDAGVGAVEADGAARRGRRCHSCQLSPTPVRKDRSSRSEAWGMAGTPALNTQQGAAA
jgi:hypothetical protein